MIVSDRHRYVFVEVPQTGSTAIRRELRQYYDGSPVLHKHANYTEFRSVANALQSGYFVFATVRNPLDAVVSVYERRRSDYEHALSDPSKHVRQGGWVPDEHVEQFDFVRRGGADFGAFLSRYFPHVYNQWVLLCHERFDFILRFENLQEDFSKALRRIGIDQVRELPTVNKTGGRVKSYLEYYPPELRPTAVSTLGPFMMKWGYDFPPEWGPVEVPSLRRLSFAAVDRSANLLARFARLNPRSQRLQAVKSQIYRVQSLFRSDKR